MDALCVAGPLCSCGLQCTLLGLLVRGVQCALLGLLVRVCNVSSWACWSRVCSVLSWPYVSLGYAVCPPGPAGHRAWGGGEGVLLLGPCVVLLLVGPWIELCDLSSVFCLVLRDHHNPRLVKNLLQALSSTLCMLLRGVGKSVLVGNINIWVCRLETILAWQQQLQDLQMTQVSLSCCVDRVSSREVCPAL